jgi:TonB-linked SusC/RagA family outer membrane protein
MQRFKPIPLTLKPINTPYNLSTKKKSAMRKHLHIILIFSLLLFVSNLAWAQNGLISGVVTDKETGEALPGVTLVEDGTLNGTTTDISGKYSLKLTGSPATLVVSFIGYTTQHIATAGKTQINIALVPEITDLSEVVVIGYGTQKKKVVTGSIASVKSEEINSTPVLRVDQAMQGRMAGVQVTNLSGQPGEAPTIRIRGTGSTRDSNPIFVVDGIVVGGIDYLAPGDIESIDVLKDAASAAIYGSNAANGVVLITTKGGKAGKMSVTYSGYGGIQNVANTLDMLDVTQYRMLMNEGARNSGLNEPFDLNEIPAHNTDWQELLFEKNAPIQSHEISMSGGNDKTTYLSSLSYFSQQGIIGGDKSQFDRITARLNTNSQVNKVFSFGNTLAYSHIKRRGIASNQSFNGAYSSALNLDPLTPLYEEDPDILALPPYSNEPVVTSPDGKVYGISNLVGAEIVNPLALLQIQTGKTRVDKLVGSIFGQAEVIKGLKIKSSLGMDLAYVLDDSFRPLFYLNGAQLNDDKTSVSKNVQRYFTWQWDNTISYTSSINNHNFSVLAGTSAAKTNYENLYGFNANVPLFDPDNVYLDMATDTVWVAQGGAYHSALASLFGRITYDYKNKYSVTAILRRDGSSRFGANNRYGNFPSLGFSWVASDEGFFPKIKQIDVVKLRASWGVNGNQNIGNYQFISTMDKSRGYIFGSGRYTGASPSYIENADIRWEESRQLNFALDLGAFNNRLQATVDYYIKTTDGLLERINIPGHVGNDAPFANVGSVQNRGVELDLTWRHMVKKLRYSTGLSLTYNVNEMTKVANPDKVLPDGASWAVTPDITRTQEGYPIAYFFGYKTDGIFQNMTEVYQHIGITGQLLQKNAQPGDVRFVDVNGDGKIDPDDRTMIGNPTPEWTIGFNASADYRNFDLSMLITGTYGNDIFNGSQRQDLRYTNRTTDILDRWTGEGTSNTIPRYTWVDVNNNYRVSDLYIEDGSYLRIKNLQIGYTLPGNLLKKMGAATWRIYVSAENLFTLTNYSGADPEIGALSALDIGIDRGIYPQARTWRIGTTISF